MLTVYSSCPRANLYTTEGFRRDLAAVTRWADEAGCRGALIFTDNASADPWVTAQFMLGHSTSMRPLVAVQPAYMHPYAAARMVSSLGLTLGRAVDLNLVTGGNPHHLNALGALIDHDERYARLVEYGQVLHRLLTERWPFDNPGPYYPFGGSILFPPLPEGLMPRIFLSGSSAASAKAQRQLGIGRLAYPKPVEEYESGAVMLNANGIRMGILARDSSEEAWHVAHRRYPPDPQGEQIFEYTQAITDSEWLRDLGTDARQQRYESRQAYWAYPARAGGEYCPYLIGSHAEVAEAMRRYMALGVDTIVLNVPREEADMHHAMVALRLAERAGAPEEAGLPPTT